MRYQCHGRDGVGQYSGILQTKMGRAQRPKNAPKQSDKRTHMETRIRNSFEKQSMMETLGTDLARVETGQVVITAPILESSQQQHGFAHAALTFAIGDSAAGYAALTLMPTDFEVLTAEMKINLLAPGKGDLLRATGRVIKSGRRLVVVAAEVHAIDATGETLVAILQGTMITISPEPA